MKEKRTYEVDVDFKYGPIETYTVEATSIAEARKKAKAKYAADYFRKSYLKTCVIEKY